MPPEAKGLSSILLILVGRFGDYIVTTPFLHGLRRRYPEAEITLITSRKAEDLARANPDLDRVLVFRGWHRPLSLARVFLAAGGRYDLAADLNPSYSRTSLRLISLARAPRKLAFAKRAPAGTYTLTLPHDPATEHHLDKYSRLAAELGFAPPEDVRIALPAAADAAGGRLYRGLGLPEGSLTVAIHPGNFKKRENRWPEEKFVEFTKEILGWEGVSVFYIEGPGEERRTEEGVLRFLPGVRHVPPQPAEVMAAVLARASILVCNNTGTLHLADAVGTPTFSFNRPYTEKCWKPRGKNSFYITSEDPESVRGIEVGDALRAFAAAVEKLRAGRRVT